MRVVRSDDFKHAFLSVLEETGRGGADIRDVLATAARIDDAGADTWVLEWIATAGEAWAQQRFRHAVTYYDAALALLEHSGERERRLALWERQRACWEAVADGLGGERIAIPYLDTALPGWFFAAPGGGRRPLVIMNNGADRATGHMLSAGGAEAAARGYHWLAFDGPGQQGALLEQGLPLRPDWEAVLTPVIDAATARPDVDAGRMAAIGIGMGGYLVTRALGVEHRLAAAVADPGVRDVSSAWTDPLPRCMAEHLRAGEREAFDREVRLALLFWPEAKARFDYRKAPYGLNGAAPSRVLAEVARYRLGAELDAIRTPLLLTEPAHERFWPGQSRALLARLPHAELTPISALDRDARIFGWLGERLA